MATVRKPLKNDPPGKCSRWRVILYNASKRKQDWVTVRGTRQDAQSLERVLKDKVARRTYIAKSDRSTVETTANAFLDECRARNRRTSTLMNYRSVLDGYIVPRFGPRELGTLQKRELRTWLTELLDNGKSAALVNRIMRTFKTLLFYAMTELEVLDRNVLMHQVYAHALPSGMASVAERVTARALGKRTKLKIIEGKKWDVRRSLDDMSLKAEKKVASS